MFEGEITKSGPGEQKIRIRDTKIATCELLQFMCTGKLAVDHMPKTAFAGALKDREGVSIEGLFLAADRYNVNELWKQTS